MQSLLTPVRRPETETLMAPVRPVELPPPVTPRSEPSFTLSERQRQVLGEIQATLRESGIKAELQEIVQAMVEALTARPTLCRGLVAAYLLEEA